MRLKVFYILTIFFTTSLYLIGCDLINPSSSDSIQEEFVSGYYFYGDNRQIELFRSTLLISAQFEENVSADEAEDLLNKFGLTIYENFHLGNTDLPDLLTQKNIVLKVSPDVDISDYYTDYPINGSTDTFGDHPLIRFSVPTFSLDKMGDDDFRYIIFDEISMSSDADLEVVSDFVSEYGLEVIDVNEWGRYSLKLTPEATMSTLAMANILYEQDISNWAHPKSFVPITTE